MTYIKKLPFYDSETSLIYGICMCSYLWISLKFLLIHILDDFEYSGQCIIIIVGIIMTIPLMKNIRKRRIYNTLFVKQFDKIQDECEFDNYIKGILQILKDKDKSELNELVLLGYMNNHKIECSNPDCILLKNERLYVAGKECYFDKVGLSDPTVVLSRLLDFYILYTKISNFKALLHITYSNFALVFLKNMHLAIFELNMAMNMSPSLQQYFTIYKAKKIIEDYYIKKYNTNPSNEDEHKSFQSLDITVVILFENISAKLQKAIEKSANEHIEFWSQLDSLIPNLNILHDIGLNITKYNIETDKIWKQLYKLNPNHNRSLKNYGLYLKDIQNDETGSELIEKAKALDIANDNMNDFNIMFADDTAIIVMSAGNKETQGKIIKTNIGITNIFQYNSLEIIGHDINVLMPKIIAEKHGEFLDNFFKSGKEIVVNSEHEVYAIRRAGGLICISLMVKLIPSIEYDIQYIGLIRERNKDSNYILTDEFGAIDSVSDTLIGYLEITHNFLKENDLFIQLIFPDLITLDKDISEDQILTKFDTLEGNVYMKFIVPNNFATLSQDYNKNSNVVFEQTSTEIIKENDKISNSLKKVSEFIYGSKHDYEELKSTTNILKKLINYDAAEVKENWNMEVINLNYGNGNCKLKIFKIKNDKANEEEFSEKIYGNINDNVMETKNNADIIYRNQTFGTVDKPVIIPELNSIKEDDKANQDEKLENTPSKEDDILPYNSKTVNNKNESDNGRTNINDLSGYLNNSISENAPLAENISIAYNQYEVTLQDQFLQKSIEIFDDEKNVINNFRTVARVDGNPDAKIEVEKKQETDLNGQKLKKETHIIDETGSIASRTTSLMKNMKALKNAVYDDYCPGPIKQLKYLGRFMFLIFLIINLVYFLITFALYNNLDSCIANIEHVKNRLNSITSIGSFSRTLILLNEYAEYGQIIDPTYRDGTDYYLDGFEGSEIEETISMTYEKWTYYCLAQSSKLAKNSQNALSTASYSFSESSEAYINPSIIKVTYKQDSDVAGDFTLDCWSAVIGLVIHGLKVKDMELKYIKMMNSSVEYIIENSFNNIFDSIINSMDAIQYDSETTIKRNKIIITILLVIASISITVSILLVIRVNLMVVKNKEDILRLFIDIPSKNVKGQLAKCRSYFLSIKDTDKLDYDDREMDLEELEEEREDEVKTKENFIKNENDEDNNKEGEDNEELESKLIKREPKDKTKKYKAYTRNIILFIIEFGFFVILFEGYFAFLHIHSYFFLNNMINLIIELITISVQSFNGGFY